MKTIKRKISRLVPALLFLTAAILAATLPDSRSVSHATAGTDTMFEKAVEIIKKYETIHQPRHWPFVGYGHKVLRGEKFSRRKAMNEADAEALLRKDLLKNCAAFREYGRDSLILGVLAYNIGSGATKRSSIVKKLAAGDRDIRDIYLAHCRYRGKVHNGILQRRTEEFDTLFEPLLAAGMPKMTQLTPLTQQQLTQISVFPI
ncbi:MAG: hypothetical protein NC336_09310 [Clostridium sp.]|nr:hypothetical protein [Clostridium sp.]